MEKFEWSYQVPINLLSRVTPEGMFPDTILPEEIDNAVKGCHRNEG